MELIESKYPHATLIHCGDNELSHAYLEPFHAVTGNNDYFHSYPEELIVEVDGIRILVTHGHQYYGDRASKLASRAINHHCQIVCYGHTHVFDVQTIKGVLCINPGSLRYNRDMNPPCYARITKKENTFNVEKLLVADL